MSITNNKHGKMRGSRLTFADLRNLDESSLRQWAWTRLRFEAKTRSTIENRMDDTHSSASIKRSRTQTIRSWNISTRQTLATCERTKSGTTKKRFLDPGTVILRRYWPQRRARLQIQKKDTHMQHTTALNQNRSQWTEKKKHDYHCMTHYEQRMQITTGKSNEANRYILYTLRLHSRKTLWATHLLTTFVLNSVRMGKGFVERQPKNLLSLKKRHCKRQVNNSNYRFCSIGKWK
jgi:hypothetical protein